MVIGLDIFREFFKDHASKYVVIGGTACDIHLELAGFTPRATRDIDIVLIVEALDTRLANCEALISLKAKAFLDMKEQKAMGAPGTKADDLLQEIKFNFKLR